MLERVLARRAMAVSGRPVITHKISLVICATMVLVSRRKYTVSYSNTSTENGWSENAGVVDTGHKAALRPVS